jgi:zona occludens toxin (predicted ATPase)
MNIFRKAKDKMMEAVGMKQALKDDPELTTYAKSVKQLLAMQSALRNGAEAYARSVLAMQQAQRQCSVQATKFYRNSAARQPVIKRYASLTTQHTQRGAELFQVRVLLLVVVCCCLLLLLVVGVVVVVFYNSFVLCLFMLCIYIYIYACDDVCGCARVSVGDAAVASSVCSRIVTPKLAAHNNNNNVEPSEQGVRPRD